MPSAQQTARILSDPNRRTTREAGDTPMILAQCSHDAGSAKFCPKCGHALVRACAQCHAPLTPDATFCGECGARGETQ
jgi:predicted amidophosphoribosyltransferase